MRGRLAQIQIKIRYKSIGVSRNSTSHSHINPPPNLAFGQSSTKKPTTPGLLFGQFLHKVSRDAFEQIFNFKKDLMRLNKVAR